MFCQCLLSADRDGLCIVSYQQKAGSMYLGDLTEESDSLLAEQRGGKGCLPSEGSSGCLKEMNTSLRPLSHFCMAVQAHPTNTEFSPS